MLSNRTVGGACALLLLTVFPVCAQDHKPAVPDSESSSAAGGGDPALVARGRGQFKSSCGFCHGEEATGARAPDLVRSTLLAHDQDGNLLTPTIRNGRPEKGMPAFPSLDGSQISAIVAFLHHQAYEAAHNANVPGDYPVSKLLTGNAEAGKAFFSGTGGCAGCHSVTGDLKGIAARLSPVDLQQAIVYPEKPRAADITAVITTREGQRYEGKVLRQDEFRIGIIGADGGFHSFAVPDVRVQIHDPLAAHRELTNRYTDADIHNLFAFLETLK